MTRAFLAGVVVCSVSLGGLVAGTSPRAQSTSPTEVPAVTVSVMVSDSKGRPVRDLPCESFRVSSAGQPAVVVGCRGDEPATISIVVDASGSMSYGSEIRGALGQVAETLGPHDRASVSWFGREVTIGDTFFRDKAQFDRAARLLWQQKRANQGPSPLWDAMDQALAVLEPQSGRRAMIVVTDGRATGGRVSFDAVSRRAMLAAIPVSFILPTLSGADVWRGEDDVAVRPRMRPLILASATGGLIGSEPYPNTVRRELQRVMAAVQAGYQLTFRPSGVATWFSQPVTVRLARAGFTVIAPESYVAR